MNSSDSSQQAKVFSPSVSLVQPVGCSGSLTIADDHDNGQDDEYDDGHGDAKTVIITVVVKFYSPASYRPAKSWVLVFMVDFN